MMIIAATNQPNNRLSPAIVEKDTECNLCMIGYHTHTHKSTNTLVFCQNYNSLVILGCGSPPEHIQLFSKCTIDASNTHLYS